jgi:MFS family permease
MRRPLRVVIPLLRRSTDPSKSALVGAAVLAIHNGLIVHAMGSYAVVLEREYGWSKAHLSLAFAMNRSESALLGPLQGWALDRLPPVWVMRVGGVLTLIGMMIFSMADRPGVFWIGFILITLGGGLSGYLTMVTIVVRRVVGPKSKPLSIVGLGIAFGGLANPLVVQLISRVGWRAAIQISGVVLFAAIIFASLILDDRFARAIRRKFDSTHNFGIFVDQGDAELSLAGTGPEHSLASALRTRAFWMLSVGHMSALLIVSAVMSHLSLFLVSERGLSLSQASFVVAAVPIFQITGIAITARFGDVVDKRRLAFAAMVCHAVGLLLLGSLSNRLAMVAFVLLHGMAWGVRGPLMQALRVDYFGTKSFGSVMGVSSIILSVGVVGGPLIAGFSADRTGSYFAGFALLAFLALVGGLGFQLMGPNGATGARTPPMDDADLVP